MSQKKEKFASLAFKFYLECCNAYPKLEDVRNRRVGFVAIRSAFTAFILQKFFPLYSLGSIMSVVSKNRTMSNYYLDRHKYDYSCDGVSDHVILYTYWYDRISKDWESSNLKPDYERAIKQIKPM